VKAPLVEGCAAWLECRVYSEPGVEAAYDLYFAEVIAAWYDDELFQDGEWKFGETSRRTIHHLSRGTFFTTGDVVKVGP
jgi:flavin reductase (DIM6/NTAB) family NADH-FMN oxidoreductase RutF